MTPTRQVSYLLALAIGAALPGIALAQVASPKIVISGPTGGAQIGLATGSQVQFDANGDLQVQCRTSGGNCVTSNLGSGSSGGNPPTNVSLSVSPSTITSGSSVTVTRASTGANGCYGTGVTQNGSTVNLPAWTGQLFPGTGGTPVTLTTGESASTYVFQMYCFSAGGASATVSSPQITVNPGETGGGGDGYCAEYYNGSTRPVPTDVRFTAHGFTKKERSFQQIWGVPIGSAGSRTGVPGPQLDGNSQYLSIPITLTPTVSQINLAWTEPQDLTSPGAIAISISPCAGDFRPANSAQAASDPFLSFQCRLNEVSLSSNGLSIARAGAGLSGCQIPVNKTVYLNIASYSMYQASGTPASTCASPPNCGVGMVAQ
ncbi:MAG: hypothetical protein WC995_01155 [Lysobacteraceae bacterium]